MYRICCTALSFVLMTSLGGICGCGESTNSVEMPSDPEPAPGPPTAVGIGAPALRSPDTAP